MDLTKLEMLHQRIVAQDNTMLDSYEALRILTDSEWIDPTSAEGLAVICALSGMDEMAGITLIKEKYPKARVTMHLVPGRVLENHRPAPWTVLLFHPSRIDLHQRATATTLGRASVVALLQMEIVTERERQADDAS
jgi:hypothetical protein